MAFDLNKLSQMAKSRPEEAKQKAQIGKKIENGFAFLKTSLWRCITIFAQ